MDELNEKLTELIFAEIMDYASMADSKERDKKLEGIKYLQEMQVNREKMICETNVKYREIELKEENSVVENDIRNREIELKEEEAKKREDNTKIDRTIKVAIAGVEFFIPMIFYSIWLHKGFKFEETGVFKSSTFRGITSKFRPFKKWW